jgi:hypothetical protein
LLIAVGLIAALVVASAPAPASSGNATAVTAKKCKRKHHKKRKCKKKQATTPVDVPYGAHFVISPTSQDFGSITHTSSTNPFTFTVTNTGNLPSKIPGVQFGGASPSAFEPVTNGCNHYLLTGGTCQITIRFHGPVAPGTYTATVSVFAADEYSGGRATATLTGKSV